MIRCPGLSYRRFCSSIIDVSKYRVAKQKDVLAAAEQKGTSMMISDENQEHQLNDYWGKKDEITVKQTTKYDPIKRRLPPLPSTGDVLRIYRVKARKQLSQNFLLDPRMCNKIVNSSHIKEGTRVVEIGPGPGNITRRILERNPAEVFLIEKDRRFLPMLEQLADAADPGQVKIILGNVLDFSLDGLFPKELIKPWDYHVNEDINFVGNLPFSVSIPLLIKWMKQMSTRSGPFAYGRIPLTLTFQKEVAERIKANVLSYSRSRISIMSQTFCKIDYKFTIKGASFTPPPKVDVGVIRIVPLEKNLLPDGMDFSLYEKFVRNFIHYRRFPLRKNLNDLYPMDMQHLVDEIFSKSGFQEDDMPIMLSAEEVAGMAAVYWAHCQQHTPLRDYDYRARKNPPQVTKGMFKDLQ